MDVLQEIFRSNGRAVNLLQHKDVEVGIERGMYYLRGMHRTGTQEIVTVYLAEHEVDKLIEMRERKRRGLLSHDFSPAIMHTLRGLGMLVGGKRRE